MPYPSSAVRGNKIMGSAAVSSLLTDLAYYFKLDEASGTRTDSVSGLTITAVDEAVTGVAGKIGDAATFLAATTTFLRGTSNAAYTTGDIDFTIAAWINLIAKPSNQAFVAKDSSGKREYLLWHDSAFDLFAFVPANGSVPVATVRASTFGTPALSTWYFVMAYHDAGGNTANISVNNGTANTAATSGAVVAGTALFSIGARDFATSELYASAIVDEAGMWKRLLTAGEKAALYNGGTGITYPFA